MYLNFKRFILDSIHKIQAKEQLEEPWSLAHHTNLWCYNICPGNRINIIEHDSFFYIQLCVIGIYTKRSLYTLIW